jgi:hypothetical protein
MALRLSILASKLADGCIRAQLQIPVALVYTWEKLTPSLWDTIGYEY